MNSKEKMVLKILAGQSPGYYAWPNAACFHAEGFDAEDVTPVLADLTAKGFAEQEQLTIITKTGREIFIEKMEAAQAAVDKANNPVSKGAAQKKLQDILSAGEPADETKTVPGGYAITNAGRAALNNG